MTHPKYNDIEVWKDIPGYEGFYQVSSWGNARSLSRIISRKSPRGDAKVTGTILKQAKNDKGYLRIKISDSSGNKKTFRVSRLVALIFVPNPNNLPEVNHDDLDKENNHYKNLSWSTRGDNIRHAFENRTIRRYSGGKNCKSKKIAQYDLMGKLIQMWPSMADARKAGFAASGICHVCKGKLKTSGGFIWKYA